MMKIEPPRSRWTLSVLMIVVAVLAVEFAIMAGHINPLWILAFPLGVATLMETRGRGDHRPTFCGRLRMFGSILWNGFLIVYCYLTIVFPMLFVGTIVLSIFLNLLNVEGRLRDPILLIFATLVGNAVPLIMAMWNARLSREEKMRMKPPVLRDLP